jgi:hypothetical protein
VNETEPDLPVLLPQKSMPAVKNLNELAHSIDEVLFALPIVVDMNFHVRDSFGAHFRQRMDQLGAVLFLRVEERIDRRSARRVRVP